ncbi:IucA/IucC family protein [Streptomyces tsukubensis]|uniref:Iron transporter n=1 Tax=Streptomyces tsukubensis TaxID=83656 RepID=A0A1V4A521_9ACTN|nr:IucA/IucC family protein [Streptomyces tsukubensis]OON75155.1 iron transporter [Streptomyces tsukubensis]QFR96100.1 iron transporter [Streptomyces tsukubensis]
MNANPAPEGRTHLPPHAQHGVPSSRVAEERAVPRQNGRGQEAEDLWGAAGDLLEHPDVRTAAESAATENLIRCWVREARLPAPARGTLRIPLPNSGAALLVPVHYWSASGWHRFGLPHLEAREAGAPRTSAVDAVAVATLLTREAAARKPAPGDGTAPPVVEHHGREPRLPSPPSPAPAADRGPDDDTGDHADHGDTGDHAGIGDHVGTGESAGELIDRVADSVRRTAVFIADRRRHPVDGPDLFLAAEQALLLGHPLHPTPKSREGLSEAENRLYSPELRGAFPLHWLAVDASVLSSDSAWTERGRALRAEQLTARLAGPGLPLPEGSAALPLHPWQARDVARRPETAALIEAGLLKPLGPYGRPWSPTSSVRTVHRSGAPAMLKLSLGLRITNSRRENLRKELHRGVEVHRLLRTGLGSEWHAAHPGFDIVRDPAWLAVTGPEGTPVQGLDVMIRHNPFSPEDDAACVAGLVSPRPAPLETGPGHVPTRSRLAQIVTRLAGTTGRPRGTVAAEWFLRYLERVVRPVLWLDGQAGVALEAHQQNTIVLLDREGWPVGGRYRDNQGYYFRESRRDALEQRLPGIGERSDTFIADDVTDERFAYYLGINNVLGLIGAFGSQGLADEHLLLAAFRGFLTDVAAGSGGLGSSLPAVLLDSPVLRCKANLLTRLHGLDELVGPVDTQSVYVSIANPLHSAR